MTPVLRAMGSALTSFLVSVCQGWGNKKENRSVFLGWKKEGRASQLWKPSFFPIGQNAPLPNRLSSALQSHRLNDVRIYDRRDNFTQGITRTQCESILCKDESLPSGNLCQIDCTLKSAGSFPRLFQGKIIPEFKTEN